MQATIDGKIATATYQFEGSPMGLKMIEVPVNEAQHGDSVYIRPDGQVVARARKDIHEAMQRFKAATIAQVEIDALREIWKTEHLVGGVFFLPTKLAGQPDDCNCVNAEADK